MKSRTLLLALVAFIKASGDLGLFDGVQKSTSLVAAAEVSATEPAVAGESFEFQAEVNRLMDIIINSLYKSKEIFLREVISNASDALDKLRFMAVSDKSALAEGDDELRIRISADKEARTITIADTGVGMTRQELIANLGTVAKSGTTNFVEALGETGDLSLIGQFGVGFYSVYLVADKVQVVSKHAGDKQYIWESTADSTFTVREDPRGDTLGRGTEIVLHLKEDADEFLEENRLADLIHRYSEFITFPIYQQREVSKEVGADDDEEEVSLDEEGDEEEEEEEEEEDAAAEDEPKGKTKTVKVKEWQRVNESTAIWARASKDVTDAEYQSFYKAISKDYSDALTWTHFKAEGDVEFKSILFIPSAAAFDHYNKYYESPAGLKLYVRKVLIKDDFEDLLPRYLNFVRGVVDSDALPLNVSRETLQQHKALQVIGKKLVRKTLDVLKKMSEESIKASEEKAKDAEEKKEGEEADGQDLDDKEDKYIKFWDEFGRNIKMGVIEDTANRSKLLKLLRFKTSKSNGKWTSLQEYVSRMKDFQKNIFYVSGENMAAVEKSPFAEKLKAKDIEIIYITDPTDEYCVQHATTFEDKKIVAASKEGIKIGDEDDKRVKALDKHYKAEYKPLTEYLKTLYDGKIAKVIVGQHGGTAPCLIVTPQYGYTANMERILKSQTFSDETVAARFSQRSMEINPRHPIVAKLNTLVGDSKESAEAEDLAWLLYDTAMAASGFTMEDAGSFSSRMYRVLGQTLKVESLDLLPEAEPDEEEEEAEEEKAADAEPDLDELYAQFQSGQQPVLDEEEEETGTDEL